MNAPAPPHPRRTRRGAVGAALAAAALAPGLTGCGSAAATGAAQAASRSPGSVAVIYAGSLTKLVETTLAPAFHRASGGSLEGFGGGSGEDAQQIKGRVRRLDVFVSASAAADRALQGAGNGNWMSWYATFARTPLVLGYDPAGSFGRELAAGKPWYEVLTQPGIRVGRTDPKLDPKGALTVSALREASRELHSPRIAAAIASFPVFPETSLVGRLQAGQLDAGFFYGVEAVAARIPTVRLAPVARSASYTVTILNGDANPGGAEAFVRFLLSPATAATLAREGLEPVVPALPGGNVSAVPAAIRDSLR